MIRKVEIIVGSLFVVGYLLTKFDISGGYSLVIASLFCLSLIYLILSHFVFHSNPKGSVLKDPAGKQFFIFDGTN